MNDFDNALILSEREFIALASLRGVERAVGLFSEEPEAFSDAEFTGLLFSLARKELVDVSEAGVTVRPQIGEAMDVFCGAPDTVVLSPYGTDRMQMSLTCAGGRIVCITKHAGSAAKLRLCMVTSERLAQYLAEDGYLDDIPEASAHNGEPFVRENAEDTTMVFRVEKYCANGERLEWTVDYSSGGCYLTDPSSAAVACCRRQMVELILLLTAS